MKDGTNVEVPEVALPLGGKSALDRNRLARAAPCAPQRRLGCDPVEAERPVIGLGHPPRPGRPARAPRCRPGPAQPSRRKAGTSRSPSMTAMVPARSDAGGCADSVRTRPNRQTKRRTTRAGTPEYHLTENC